MKSNYLTIKPIYLIILGLLTINTTCNKVNNEDLKLRVNNMSNIPIYTAWTIDYPDTSFNHVANPIYNPQIHKIEAYSIQKNYYGAPSKGLFNDKVDTISVFIFDAHVLETAPWDTVKANYLVLKRYDLSLQDLQIMNWTITYP
ncbi:MAG: hypothetical protein M0R21_08655 [Lentimicrobiaceae bacterium]|nr:hypothetical protein [Lentimicrobiaceae bacterium]